ncbi:hypothetical protein V8C26DRAFT_396370 [Trichoderma gracile]
MRRQGREQSSSPHCQKPSLVVKRPSSGESTGLCDGQLLRTQSMASPRPRCDVLSRLLDTITACSASHGSTGERCTRTWFSVRVRRTGSCFGAECEEPCQDIPAKAKTQVSILIPDHPRIKAAPRGEPLNL